MRLAMAQMRMSADPAENLAASLRMMERAARKEAQLIFFPEVQLSPFFPAEEAQNADRWLLEPEGPEITAIRDKCRELGIWASPNVYLRENGRRYDASLMIDAGGRVLGVSKMVHIAQAEHFYERDYYSPSDTGFRVYETPFGRIGIVICFDRHIPDGVRSCARQGAELVIIPTANVRGEPMEIFEWELRIQAFQSSCFVAMCNRVGREGKLKFAGESLVTDPQGQLLLKAGDQQNLFVLDLPLDQAREVRKTRPYLDFELIP